MKKTFRSAMLSTICMLVVAVMSLTGVTYAWFQQGEKATVTGMQMNVDVAEGGFEVSTAQNGTYGNALTLTVNTDQVKPVSTANAKNFYDVEFNPANTAEIKSIAGNATNVIVQDLWLRNTSTEEVVYVNLIDSVIKAAVNSKFGGATNDAYLAARMAILNAEGNIIGGIYSPDPDEASYNALQGTSNGYFAAYTGTDAATTSITTVGLDDIEIELPKMSNANTYNPVHIQVVIWLEGQDTDAKQHNAGGAFDISLNFQKVDKTQG